MPIQRPTLTQLIERASADIEARLIGTDARLRRSFLNVLARVQSGAVHGLYGFVSYLAEQLIYDTATAEYLDRWASIYGLSRTPAFAASGSVVFTGINGIEIPAGTVLTRSDSAEFVTAAAVTIVGGTATASVTASVAGTAGNTAAGTMLNMASPIAGINAQVTVDVSSISGGADDESDDALRARLLLRIQQPPQGGAAEDYENWALAVAGVTRVWVSPLEQGAGTVVVRFVRDNDASLIPDAGEVAAVQTYIDERRPVTAAVTVLAPVPVPLDFTIALTPNTAAVKAAVEASLRDLLLREAEPGATILLTHIREAVSVAAGENDHTITAPVANVVHSTGQMATFGAITWV